VIYKICENKLIGSWGKQYIVYGECWFNGKFYFKHGGSQNATLKSVAINTHTVDADATYFQNSSPLMWYVYNSLSNLPHKLPVLVVACRLCGFW